MEFLTTANGKLAASHNLWLRPFRHWLYTLIAALCLLIGSPAAASGSNAISWLRENVQAPSDGFMVSRVLEIFDDVKRASGSQVHPSKLFIIQSNSIPWAIALEDKNIILTSGAIDVIYSGDDSMEKKDARMAFVLGHELKHVIENDFSHEQAYNNFSQSTVSDLVALNSEQSVNRRTLELLADEEGLIYASLAGYDTSAIFSGVGGADNFLEYWAKQTNTNNNNQHYSPAERIEYLKESYQSIDYLVEFFKYGVRLAHFGSYETSQRLLDDFYKVYESDRVLANRGYVHLQLARKEMLEQVAYRYWLPDLLNIDSGFPVMESRAFGTEIPISARQQLNQAVALLSQGLSYSTDDTTTRKNLISAHIYLGEYSAARAVMEKIDGWEQIPDLVALDALIVLQNKRIKDPWNTYALEALQQLVIDPDAEPTLIYNYARLLKDNGRARLAAPYWERLASMIRSLPKNFQVMVCREVKDPERCVTEIEQYGVRQHPWVLKINPGDLVNSREVREVLHEWGPKPIESISGVDAQIYPDGDGNSLLVVDGVVKLVTIKQHGIDFKDALIWRFGEPNQVIKTGAEELWSYGSQWSAVVSGSRVREVWIAQ